MKHLIKTKDGFDFCVHVNDKECPPDFKEECREGISFWTRYRARWIRIDRAFSNLPLLEEIKTFVNNSTADEVEDILDRLYDLLKITGSWW